MKSKPAVAAAVVALVLAIVPGWSGDERMPLYRGTPRVRATFLPHVARDPAVRRVGALRYLGGVELAADDRAFGGFSSMVVLGGDLLLLSDGGLWYRFGLRDWRPVGERFGRLPDGPGTGWRKEERDSESMTHDPATGRIWVGFERADAIWRYAPDLARAERWARPPAMRRWPDNGGAEAMVRLVDGRFLVFSESKRVAGGGREALIFADDPTLGGVPARFAYLPPAGYDVTDATQMPDGRLLILQRRLSFPLGWTAIVSLVDTAGIRAGARVRGREVARFAGDVLHDNFEGIAAVREGMRTTVWTVSDDNNRGPGQRTLLLKFAWDG